MKFVTQYICIVATLFMVSCSNHHTLDKLEEIKVIGNHEPNKALMMLDSLEIDVRGETAVDAIMIVDRAIDTAVMQKLHQITIIHGKGTGILRREIQNHLKKHPSVRTFRLGVFGEGDYGVTIAELK